MKINIDIYDKSVESLFDITQEIKEIANGFVFTEGPIWNSRKNTLVFSDIPTSKLYRWDAENGAKLIKENTNKGNGNAYDHLGRIITCEGTSNRVARMDDDGGNYRVMASHYEGKELNSPNDVIVHSNGMIYFTDPQFGRRPTGAGLCRPQQLDFQGVYMLNPDTFQLTLAADDAPNPNGLCFTPDEKSIYVADSAADEVYLYDVKLNGCFENRRSFCRTVEKGPGKVDGIKIDMEGNLWCAAPGGVQIFDRGGRMLGAMILPERTGNLCFGDADLKTLYICSGSTVITLRTKIPGKALKY